MPEQPLIIGVRHHSPACARLVKERIEQEYQNILSPSSKELDLTNKEAVDDYFKPDHVIVIHDDLDLPFGTLRFKIGGGHGGHNGLRSIDAHIGVEYTRVRIGIGKPVRKSDVAKYVLSDFSACQRKFLPEILLHVTKSVQALLLHDLKEVSLQYSLKQTLCGGDEV
ncbi:MAG: hypothetical protein EOM49_08015 [Epsilonproteobacteria bacterium]|nr:hypothetical protein [Campylobacterota bacterium]